MRRSFVILACVPLFRHRLRRVVPVTTLVRLRSVVVITRSVVNNYAFHSLIYVVGRTRNVFLFFSKVVPFGISFVVGLRLSSAFVRVYLVCVLVFERVSEGVFVRHGTGDLF